MQSWRADRFPLISQAGNSRGLHYDPKGREPKGSPKHLIDVREEVKS